MPMPRILVIEDEPGIADVLQVNLLAAGHQVAIVADGQEVLAVLMEHSPDLVILDLNLPRVFRILVHGGYASDQRMGTGTCDCGHCL